MGKRCRNVQMQNDVSCRRGTAQYIPAVVFSTLFSGSQLASKTDPQPEMGAVNLRKSELPHDKTNKMASAPSEDSDQPGHLPSLIRVFAGRMKKAKLGSIATHSEDSD